jgi:ABC-2 type transport system ATP-binding protein
LAAIRRRAAAPHRGAAQIAGCRTLRVREHIHLLPPATTRIRGRRGHRGGGGWGWRSGSSAASGGQQKRALFALALCGNRTLVLDGPTTDLDVEARRGLWKQIRAFISGNQSVP